MIYIGKRGLTDSKHLFPGKDGFQYCAKTFSREVKFLMTDVLKKTQTNINIFGTHIWRKVAYAVALVGKF